MEYPTARGTGGRPPAGIAFSSGAAGATPALAAALARLDRRVDWERRARGTQGSGMRVTIEPARDLLARLGSPDRDMGVVHVAGTKGKGSVSSLVHHALARAGVRTGCYASPHVSRVNERIRIDGAEIDDDSLARVLAAALDALDDAEREGTAAREASWFDVMTAAAVLAFHEAGVEWAVVECGLGGRLDSTNALEGAVCVVTGIDLEHTEVLGSTRAAIAREKAGILHPGAVLVCAVPEGDEADAEISARARELGVPVIRPELDGGSLEAENVAVAKAVLDLLGGRGVPVGGRLLDDETVRAARLPGRLELIRSGGVTVALDGAHVPASLERVLEDLRREGLSPPAAACVLGLGRDKDLPGLLKVLRGRVDRVICTSVGVGLARSPEEIRSAAERIDLAAETAVTPRGAIQRGLNLAYDRGWILVTGSLHLIGAIKPHISEEPRC